MMPTSLTRIAAACMLLFSQAALSASLQDILRQSLINDPELLEAGANVRTAETDIKIAEAGHQPTLSLTASQILMQKHRYESNDRPSGIDPGVQGKLNLYSWGGVNAKIRQSEFKRDYYHHKYYETQEILGQTVGQLYLSALRAKESILAANNNLQRHNQIINDLTIITRYDKGRQSELDQAISRRLRVEAYLAAQTRSLELYLSRLGKYTGTRINPTKLEDPFARETIQSLIKNYQNQDLGNQPSYLAQQAERESVLAELDVNKAARHPSIDLIASASRDNREVYINLGWDFYNPASKLAVERSAQTLVAAEAKSDQILRDTVERTRSSEVDMQQSLRRVQIAEQQIAAQKKVIKAYELQFKIARRTLIDVLDSYSDLWNIESELVTAKNDFRDAALEYLSSQSAIAQWAGLNEDRTAPEHKPRKDLVDYIPEDMKELGKEIRDDAKAFGQKVNEFGNKLKGKKDQVELIELDGNTSAINAQAPLNDDATQALSTAHLVDNGVNGVNTVAETAAAPTESQGVNAIKARKKRQSKTETLPQSMPSPIPDTAHAMIAHNNAEASAPDETLTAPANSANIQNNAQNVQNIERATDAPIAQPEPIQRHLATTDTPNTAQASHDIVFNYDDIMTPDAVAATQTVTATAESKPSNTLANAATGIVQEAIYKANQAEVANNQAVTKPIKARVKKADSVAKTAKATVAPTSPVAPDEVQSSPSPVVETTPPVAFNAPETTNTTTTTPQSVVDLVELAGVTEPVMANTAQSSGLTVKTAEVASTNHPKVAKKLTKIATVAEKQSKIEKEKMAKTATTAKKSAKTSAEKSKKRPSSTSTMQTTASK